jgi:ATP-binding cassette subfamily B protein/subfamily B ATP-binding cassette protein MsbA
LFTTANRKLSRLKGKILAPFLDQSPAQRLIRQTARKEWKSIATNMGSGILVALSEGATIGVIFLAVGLLANPNDYERWQNSNLLAHLPVLQNWLGNASTTTLFVALMSLAVALQAINSLCRYINNVSGAYFGSRIMAKITSVIHSQVLKLDFPCASSYRVGELTYYANSGPSAIRSQINVIADLVLNTLMAFGYLFVLVSLSPWLLFAAIAMGVVITAIQKKLLPKIGRVAQQLSSISMGISGRINEDIQGLRLLHSSGQLDTADRRLKERMGDLEKNLYSQARLVAITQPIAQLLPIMAISIIAILSVTLFQSRQAGILPSLVAFVIALQRLNMRFSDISNGFTMMKRNSGDLNCLNDILKSEDKSFRRTDGEHFQGLKKSILLNNVQLVYGSSTAPALRGVTIDIPKGKTIALVGRSGAGKSSIADLLVGLYSPTAGSIEIDGKNLNTINLASWQQRLGVVSQDTFLFNATLAENISFGCEWATLEDVKRACEIAQADSFIEKLPSSYQTIVGERGYRLSGGQRQRISLARAILRNPDLLILDEATSALDTHSERLVQQAIERFENQHTVLVIAHRLSTIMNAHCIYVMERGKVIEQGSHDQLIAKEGSYFMLWKSQSQTIASHEGALA